MHAHALAPLSGKPLMRREAKLREWCETNNVMSYWTSEVIFACNFHNTPLSTSSLIIPDLAAAPCRRTRQGCSNVFSWEGLSPPNLGQKVDQIRGETPIFTDFGCTLSTFYPLSPSNFFDKTTPMGACDGMVRGAPGWLVEAPAGAGV